MILYRSWPPQGNPLDNVELGDSFYRTHLQIYQPPDGQFFFLFFVLTALYFEFAPDSVFRNPSWVSAQGITSGSVSVSALGIRCGAGYQGEFDCMHIQAFPGPSLQPSLSIPQRVSRLGLLSHKDGQEMVLWEAIPQSEMVFSCSTFFLNILDLQIIGLG